MKAFNLSLIQYFLRLLTNELDEIFLHRLLYTLSTLLRSFPRAQTNFLEHGGAELMVKLLDSNHKIAIRVLTLINDLITEKVHFIRGKKTEHFCQIFAVSRINLYGQKSMFPFVSN